MNIRPIRTEADYEWALAEIEPYFDHEPAPGSLEADRFDILADLIAAYEARYWPIEPTDPITVIHGYMDAHRLKQKDLAELLGSRSRASEVLRRKRPLTMEMAWKIHSHWRIPAESLLRPYPIAAE